MNVTLFHSHPAMLGPYLRTLRLERGLSLRVAAARLGISFAKLQKMETGGRFRIGSPALFDAFAALFERPVGEVLAHAGVHFEPPGAGSNATPVSGQMWEYTARAGWSRIAGILAEYDEPNGGDVDVSMTAAGFGPSAVVWGREHSLMIEVHPTLPNEARTYAYFVWVNVGSTSEAVACRTLPDLFALLREVKPLVDPVYVGIAAAEGWQAGGRPVAAFGLRADGSVHPLVAARKTHETGFMADCGPLVFRG
ncbi:MAG: helix-turn-helix transcriptional regulator [Pseudomonadota bacterium]|nr:helix-turn-helix transcriptional regulator [Pseudomonadota bacterium]